MFNENIAQAQLEIQEETFQSISREIHDNIGLSLTLAKLHLNTLDLNSNYTNKSLIDSSIELISIAINDLSDISKNLNSDIIVDHGLLNLMEIKIDKLKKCSTYVVTFDVVGQPVFINSQKELILYRIFQEAINNIIKHSKATEIIVTLGYDNDNIKLEIHDNGVGINQYEVERARPSKIMTGLSNIKKRTKMLNGVCNIASNQAGTTICVTVPI